MLAKPEIKRFGQLKNQYEDWRNIRRQAGGDRDFLVKAFTKPLPHDSLLTRCRMRRTMAVLCLKIIREGTGMCRAFLTGIVQRSRRFRDARTENNRRLLLSSMLL